ncbi:MAG TPA: acyl-CoA dehydrogenase family protein [bacterium]|nr:acyl-CoA dehydrogenase family protein [bacterium]
MRELTEEQKKLQEGAVALARGKLGKNMIERDREETFDREGWKACADFGVMAMPVPEEYGGLGLGLTELIAVMEGLGYGSKDAGLIFSINAHMWTVVIPLLIYGSEEQKKKYLPGLINGDLIGANAATEPDSGSDVFAMRSHAVKKGDGYVVSGTKMFCTNAPVADVFALYATVDPALGATGVTAFLVERSLKGVSVPRPMEKMGLRTSPMAEVVLDECELGPEQRLGKEGRGAAVFDCSMEWERGCILAGEVGVMRRQLEECIRYARERKQFGKAIGKYQSVANRIVDMKIRLETCLPLVYRIGELKDAGKDARLEASMAKLWISECFVQSSLDAMRTFGSYGYMTEQELERDLRDGLGGVFYSGTSDIQRNIIARGLGL